MKKVILFFWIAAFLAVPYGRAQSDRPGDDRGTREGRGAKEDQGPRDAKDEKAKAEKPVHPSAGHSTANKPAASHSAEGRPAAGRSTEVRPQAAPRPSGPARGKTEGRPQAVPAKFKRLGVTQLPQPITDRKVLPDNRKERSMVGLPAKDEQGRVFKGSPITREQMGKSDIRKHMDLIHDALFTGEVRQVNDREREVNRYYWHQWKGRSYCHYYDRWGSHWYGWSFGPSFFWTRYAADRWWWYDPGYGRWCYWHNGFWWWQDPYHVNVVYIYMNGGYEAAETTQVLQPVDAPSGLSLYRSPDGTREVKVYGATGDAFLYDAAVPHSFDPVYLASGVKEVKFSASGEGKPLQILLVLQDDTFGLYDGFGNPYASVGE